MEFCANGHQEMCREIGAIDAPDLILLGSHEHIVSMRKDFHYSLPTVAYRECMQ